MGNASGAPDVAVGANELLYVQRKGSPLIGHTAWDVHHHRVNRVVVCSMAEFRLVLDTALAAAVVMVTMRQ